MSCINNEALYETIYEEFMEELYLTDTLDKYSEREILKICNQRFEDMCQWNLLDANLSTSLQQ